MGADHYFAAFVDLIKNCLFCLLFPSLMIFEKWPWAQVMVDSWFNHLPEIKPCCHFLEAMEHYFSAFEDFPKIGPKLIFLQFFAFIIEPFVNQKQTRHSITNCMHSFISSSSSSPLICLHQLIIIISLQKPSLKKSSDELIFDGSSVLLFLML